MATCNTPKKCGCSCGSRIVSPLVSQIPSNCFDVCVNPICGDPDKLSLMAPLIYDEIGINLCATFDLGTAVATAYPTATQACVQVISITYNYGPTGVSITNLSGRPNCYQIVLSNLTVNFSMALYDSECRYLGTINPTANYLPSTGTPTYDEDTNPSSVTLDIFAPYGVSYNLETGNYTPALNYVGFQSGDNTTTQGLNLFAIPKILDLDVTATTATATVGLTLVIQSLYFSGYNVASAGKIHTPKGSIISPEDSDCMKFVAGDLLDLAIKPLDLDCPLPKDIS